MHLTPMAQLILTAVLPAAELIRRNFWQPQPTAVTTKRDFQDVVTQTDRESQTTIVTELTRLMRIVGNDDLQFIGEENLSSELAPHTFIIDPIDGTANFANKVPYCCISVAYLRNQKLHTGLVLNPITGEYWWATKGQGSYHVPPSTVPNAAELAAQKLTMMPKSLAESVVITHYNSLEYAEAHFNDYRKLFDKVQAERNFGAMALDLCYLASNGFQAVLSRTHALWDIAGAFLVVTEAGGTLCDYTGKAISLLLNQPKKTYQVVASHPSLTTALITA